MERRSYTGLKERVWDKGTCSGCGACVAVCPADAICFDEPGGAVRPKNIGYCKMENDGVPCGACYDACPRAGGQGSTGLGAYREILSARATFDIPRRQAGGAVTAILATALEQGLIDGVVTVTADRLTLAPRSVVLTSGDAVLATAGSRYSWWVPLVSALKTAVIGMKLRNIAIVGVPCVARAVSLIRESENDLLVPYGSRIRLSVGLFCTEIFDYRVLVEEILGKEHGIRREEIARLDVRGKLEVTKRNGEKLTLPLLELESAIRPGCHSCTDFTAVCADISAGAVGSPPGYTTLVVRTIAGQVFVDEAVAHERIERGPPVETAAIERLAAAKAARNGG
ncbi:MAG: Coenzyme F420 hydrogenase/dehydrogenase, beta subunit C-terminal domain [Methanolinea sp.]|nr:Coenzyme F420 hydrogenase/dehydrogenase, beta subunit C-terminal domain [Methanolinea sp.]